MTRTPVIVIFDIGKTNKKLFLFDEQYHIFFERSVRFSEITDEDGDPCEDLESLHSFVFDSLREISERKDVEIKAVNFSTYGASLVYLNAEGRPLTPLYNYLKIYPAALQERFYQQYGGADTFSLQTASPVLGSLNAGMQLYRLKYQQPEVFKQLHYVLHLPQYMSYLLTGTPCTDITSIGCHTNLWDFPSQRYHHWLGAEQLLEMLPRLVSAGEVFAEKDYVTGAGLHDSSAALIPYLVSFREPFILLSTGTWCISLNPFNNEPLTAEELRQDCLCYMTYEGRPVKASRLFSGYEHEREVKRIATHFGEPEAKYPTMRYDPEIRPGEAGSFAARDLHDFASDVEAYHQLMYDIAVQQYHTTRLVWGNGAVSRVFVDGGFSRNTIYMNMLAGLFRGVEVYAASMAQASALGAALAIHKAWNGKGIPNDLIALQYYAEPGL